jgi:hypothetical protein
MAIKNIGNGLVLGWGTRLGSIILEDQDCNNSVHEIAIFHIIDFKPRNVLKVDRSHHCNSQILKLSYARIVRFALFLWFVDVVVNGKESVWRR